MAESRNVSIKVLKPKTRALISDLLNPQMFMPAPNGKPRDWQGLAGLCNLHTYHASLVRDTDPTNKVLNLWAEEDPERSTVDRLLIFLEELDRFDIVADIEELIDEDIRIHRTNPPLAKPKSISLSADKYIITTDDVKRISEGRALENYDAFLLYDQDDIEFASQVLDTMEKGYSMKFCVKDRDLVGGGLEMDKMITLITERCNRVVVVLSDAFFKSSANDYYVKFAQACSIDQDDRKIIPIEYKEFTSKPPNMQHVFSLKYKKLALFNFWEKLRDSITVVDPEKMKIARSKSDTAATETIRSALHKSNVCTLKPLADVRFSSSACDLSQLEVLEEPPSINPSTSADNLSTPPCNRKEKKNWFLKKIKGHWKKDKNDCQRAEREKKKSFLKPLKRTAAVAN